MVTYSIGDQAYPLALTLGAMDELDKLCGGFENVTAAFDGKSMVQIIDITVQMLAILLRGGYHHLIEMGEAPKDPPTAEALRSLMLSKDIGPTKEAMFQAMAESMGRTVEVEPAKNGETTTGEA